MKITAVVAILLLVSIEALSAPNDPSRGARRIYQIPASIPADCSRDVTAEINAWLRTVPNGTSTARVTLLFGRNACYRVDGTLGAIYGSTDQAGFERRFHIYEGNGATIDGSHALPPPFTNRSGFSFMYGRGLTVRNFIIKGSHPSPCNAVNATQPCRIVNGGSGYDSKYEFQHGIAFFASSDVAVLNNRIYGVYGDGVTIAQGSALGHHVRGARVVGNTIDGTGRMGVAVTAGDGVLIQGNAFDRVSYHVIDLEPEAGNPVRNIRISSNVIRRHYLGFVASAGGECMDRSNIRIEANRMNVSGITTFPPIVLDPNIGFGCTNMSGVTIKGNVLVHDNQGGGYYVDGVNITPYHNSSVQVRYVTNVRVNENRIIQARTDTSAVWLQAIEGVKEVKRNDMRNVAYAYIYGASYDGTERGQYHSAEVDACGNVTLAGAHQPQPCP